MNLEAIAAITSRLTSYAVIGGYALAVHGHVRHTADFDVPGPLQRRVNAFLAAAE
jgi:hypothetical protein